MKLHTFYATRSAFIISFLVAIFSSSNNVAVSSALFWRKRRSSLSPSRSSLTRVNPKNIIGQLVKYGGLVLPKSAKSDLNIIASVCDCETTYLDVYARELLVQNFTVAAGRGSIPALHVGRFLIRWNSYRRPCIEIELEDCEILVEFVNLMLTNTNWSELNSRGFPPMFAATAEEGSSKQQSKKMDQPVAEKRIITPNSEQRQPVKKKTITVSKNDALAAQSNTFVRIGSIQLLGEVKLRIRSRPLDKILCPDFVFGWSVTKEINDRVREASNMAQGRTGRPGCTTDELYDIVQSYIKEKLFQLLQATALDMGKGMYDPNVENRNFVSAKKVLVNTILGAKETVTNYALGIAGATIHKIEKTFTSLIDKISTGQLFF